MVAKVLFCLVSEERRVSMWILVNAIVYYESLLLLASDIITVWWCFHHPLLSEWESLQGVTCGLTCRTDSYLGQSEPNGCCELVLLMLKHSRTKKESKITEWSQRSCWRETKHRLKIQDKLEQFMSEYRVMRVWDCTCVCVCVCAFQNNPCSQLEKKTTNWKAMQ